MRRFLGTCVFSALCCESLQVFKRPCPSSVLTLRFFFSLSAAFPAARERQEAHLAPRPCGADRVAGTALGHFHPRPGGI